jgi:PTH2 family peptidyl-tRNA hydrolase
MQKQIAMSEFDYKQVLVLRVDLGMSRGKIAAQAAHAAVSASEKARGRHPKWWEAWLKEGQCKIAAKVESEEELLDLEQQAKDSLLPHALIQDRGLTELPQGTLTSLGIGPAPTSKIDKITGKLPLL